MTMFSAATRSTARWHTHGHAAADCAGALLASVAIAAVAYLLWPTWGVVRTTGPGPAAGQRRRHAVQRADSCGPHEDPAPLRTAGARRSQLQLPVARSRRSRRNMSAPRRSTRLRSRSTASSSRSRRITMRSRRRCGCAPSIRAISSPRRSTVQDGLTMRSFRDGTPYGSEDLFLAEQPRSPRAARAMAGRPACA